jgi:uncharacterized protein (UPF0335 family)
MTLNRHDGNYEIDLSFRSASNKRAACRRRHAELTGRFGAGGPIRAGLNVNFTPTGQPELDGPGRFPRDGRSRRLTRAAEPAMAPDLVFTSPSMDQGMSTDNASTDHVNAAHLRAFIERIEKLEEEKKAIAEDIKEVYGEAKGTGFDVKIIRKIVSIRKQDRDKRREEEEILDLYLSALGIE